MKLGVLFSGGKDSAFACYQAMDKHDVCCLISVVSENSESYMFHTPNISLVREQAKAMDIPIIVEKSAGKKEKELDDLCNVLQKAKDEFGIEGIVTGAIESVYQASRVQKICKDLGLWCFNPLWKIDQVKLLNLLIDKGFKVIISGIGAYPFDDRWLGREIDKDCVDELILYRDKYEINPSGEGGEFESLVLDAPMFKQRLEVMESSVDYADHSGVFRIDKVKLVGK